ncbi:MAG: M24 family metallopeptidase [Deltaproteobacteria bacterium]|nr:M24 family metallopeptidase [Deltaproteobacteria bacterium]
MANDAEIRIKNGISTPELERRWTAVRQAMKESALDFLILQNSNDVLGGYLKWFTDLFAYHDFTSTVIFPRDDEMTTVWHGPALPGQPSPPPWAVRGVKKRISVPAVPSLNFTNHLMAEKVVEELQGHKNARIGFVGPGFISAAFYNYVTSRLPGAVFTDATELVDKIKAIKSDEEIALLKRTAALQDQAFEYILTRVRPGRTEREVFDDCANKCRQLGTSQACFMGSSAPPGKPARLILPSFANKVIDVGDQFTILLETNGPGGVWTELQRTICLGVVTPELEDHFALAKALQKVTLDLLRPGADPREIWAANNAFLRSHGYPEEHRIYAHSMGYDMVERPGISQEETMTIRAGMNIAVHPAIASDKAFGMYCENYLVQEAGAPLCLHQTPQQIFKI